MYKFGKDAKQGDRSNLVKLLKIREKKGILRRLGYGEVEVDETHYEEVVKIIQRYSGIVLSSLR